MGTVILIGPKREESAISAAGQLARRASKGNLLARRVSNLLLRKGEAYFELVSVVGSAGPSWPRFRPRSQR